MASAPSVRGCVCVCFQEALRATNAEFMEKSDLVMTGSEMAAKAGAQPEVQRRAQQAATAAWVDMERTTSSRKRLQALLSTSVDAHSRACVAVAVATEDVRCKQAALQHLQHRERVARTEAKARARAAVGASLKAALELVSCHRSFAEARAQAAEMEATSDAMVEGEVSQAVLEATLQAMASVKLRLQEAKVRARRILPAETDPCARRDGVLARVPTSTPTPTMFFSSFCGCRPWMR